jgi:hypothetical protein
VRVAQEGQQALIIRQAQMELHLVCLFITEWAVALVPDLVPQEVPVSVLQAAPAVAVAAQAA